MLLILQYFIHTDMDLCGLRAALKLTEHQNLHPKTSATNGIAAAANDVPLSMTFCPKKGVAGRLSPCHDLGYHTLLTRTPTPPPIPVTSTLMSPSSYAASSCSAASSSACGDLAALLQTAGRSSSCSSPRPLSRPTSWSDIPSSRSSPFPFPQESSSESSRTPSVGRGSSIPYTDRLITTFKGKRVARSCCHFDRLTDDLILKIFSYLSSNQLCVSARVCRRWYFLAWEPQLWSSITLSGERIHVDKGLKTLFRLLCRDSPTVCLAVERISLNGCRRLTDKGLSTVAVRCPELKTLELKGCVSVTNNGVSDVVSRCHNLARLDATGCLSLTTINIRSLTPDSASTTSSNLQLYLQYLDLTDCQNVSDSGLQQIAQNCPQLSHLYLRRCSLITDCSLKAVSCYCPGLRELSVSDCVRITDFGLYELAKLGPNLRYLSVAKCEQVSDAGVKQIARHCYKLRYLNVRGCEAVSDDAMEVIARSCSRLRALDVGKCDVTDNGLRMIAQNCINLRKLSVKSCELVTDNGVQTIAYYCRGLQQLNIQDCVINLNAYRTVKKFCKKCIIEHTNPGFS